MIYTARTYAFIFIILVLLSPLILVPFIYVAVMIPLQLIPLPGDGPLSVESLASIATIGLGVAVLVVNGLLLICVWRRCSSRALSFFEGLEMIASGMMSGCANITLIYMYPNLTIVYIRALFHTIAGLKKGKQHTEQTWIRLVRRQPTYRLDL